MKGHQHIQRLAGNRRTKYSITGNRITAKSVVAHLGPMIRQTAAEISARVSYAQVSR